jgi:hypothetical protein
LRAAGFQGESPFTETALESVFQRSQAIPRLVNLICNGAMVQGASRNLKKIDAGIIERVATSLELTEPVGTAAKPYTISGALFADDVRVPNTIVDMLIDVLKNQRGAAGRQT